MNNQVFNSEGAALNVKAFHPGEFLLEEILERNLLKKDVAKTLGIMPHHLSAIFKGDRNISPKLAIKIETLFDISAEYWMNMQTAYDLSKAREELFAEEH
ncbi:HigA family addiction module antitoxin [Sphingobacterium bambusae]|uniref:HigA family addiction module antitoxin n=1 Tax=Sphingobacterium bambusae TaxID=662858 RepID=A0ABW6BAU2_9SPHI|nr:HigA family addiction module antitoxin [Sphingobacterium bambusae]WPL48828.1 HigA family addiction module antitoxin [Sphingobacterium bambusae]